MSVQSEFLKALSSTQRAPELAEVDDVFGWMIGSWEMDAILHHRSGQKQLSKGELHASWVLEGRAIQDLFIFPSRAERQFARPAKGDRYATTIRTYDPKLKSWRVTFINPACQETNAQLRARLVGSNVEMEGKLDDGTPIRWRYRNITPISFYYMAEKMEEGGKSWLLYLELLGKR